MIKTKRVQKKSYQIMYDTYCQIFKRCLLKFKAVEADTGNIGGNYSHEFMVLADTGEDLIANCRNCAYVANRELAEVSQVKIGQAQEHLPLEKIFTPGKKSVDEVTRFMNISSKQLLKTIIFTTDNKTIAVLVRGDHEVNEAKLKKIVGCENLSLATEDVVFRTTGASVGFSGPIGLKDIKIIADNEIKDMFNFVLGANEKDMHFLNANYARDFNIDTLGDIRFITPLDTCPRCQGQIEIIHGIEVGHTFQLGTKYSSKLKATFLDESGNARFFDMGCYGIGIGRTVAAAIEQNHDENGIIWPLPLAPFEVTILLLNTNNPKVIECSGSLYDKLLQSGLDVLLDDRLERPGVKFKDADLIGIPIQIIIGERSLNNNKAEIKIRRTGERLEVDLEDVVNKVIEIKGDLIKI
ncbi:MAG: proline--tRNA ligase [bacterium]